MFTSGQKHAAVCMRPSSHLLQHVHNASAEIPAVPWDGVTGTKSSGKSPRAASHAGSPWQDDQYVCAEAKGSIGMPPVSHAGNDSAGRSLCRLQITRLPGLAGDAFSLMAGGCFSSSGVRSLSILEKTDRMYEL